MLIQQLDKDTSQWTNNLENVKDQAEKWQNDILQVIAENQERLEVFVRKIGTPNYLNLQEVPAQSLQLKKLSRWGEQESVPEFEWPTQEEFNKLSPDLTVKNVIFKTNGAVISSIAFQMSDGS